MPDLNERPGHRAPCPSRTQARDPRRKFGNETVAWQLASQCGGWAAFRSYVDQSADRRPRRKDPTCSKHGLDGTASLKYLLAR
jgi:hypothetical protein